ncbi:MAG: hypothetical protein V4734_07185, partial [Terriglobus sp.]
IVVGLLIAVGLEQTVEYFHHRSEVNEARERIRTELEGDRGAIRKNSAQLQKDMAKWTAYGMQLSDTKVTAEQVGAMDFSWFLLLESNSAWENTKQSNTFSYMPPAEAEMYAYFYRVLAEDYAVATRYIEDVRTADAIVQRVHATHVLTPSDRERLIAMVDMLNGRAKNQVDLYQFLDEGLGIWLEQHRMINMRQN